MAEEGEVGVVEAITTHLPGMKDLMTILKKVRSGSPFVVVLSWFVSVDFVLLTCFVLFLYVNLLGFLKMIPAKPSDLAALAVYFSLLRFAP